MIEIRPNFMFGILLLGLVIVTFGKTFIEWKKEVDKKNVLLMQLYLELKFLYKNLSNSASTASSVGFCKLLISSMKEYYNLEEIIVIDSLQMNLQTHYMNVLKSSIHNFLQQHSKEIAQKIKNRSYLTQYVEINKKKYLIYIFELFSKINCDSFIVCIENYPTLLSKNELLGLENNVNLLRTRLISDD